MTITIDIARRFSPSPAGRFRHEGPFSGEAFRDDILLPVLQRGDSVEILLDTADGYGSSFLEETFGGLVRVKNFTPSDLLSRITLITEDSSLRNEITSYIEGAQVGG